MYNPHTVVVRLVMPEGYYDEYDDLTDDGRATLTQVLEDADIEIDTIEQ